MSLVLLKPSLQELRELIGATESPQKDRSPFSLYSEGFPVGAIIEIFGFGKTELISLFLKENSSFKTAWIENEISINPYALFQKGVKTENVLFIEAKGQLIWCLTQALQSNCFQALIVHDHLFDERELRRFQLLSEKSHAHLFLLSTKPHQSWVPQLQLQTKRNKQEGIQIKFHRKRGHG